MSRQNDTTAYRVRYSTDRNAALQPEFIPQPERRPAGRERQRLRHERALRAAEVKRYALLILLTVAVAAAGFLVVTRNAEIYQNTQEIRALAKQRQELEILINTAVKDGSAGSDMNSYFDAAQNQLNLSYPSDSEIVTVACASSGAGDATEESVAEGNVYDAVLDFFSSLGEGIRSWIQK